MLIELSNCKVNIKDFVDRRTDREYKAEMYKGVDIAMTGASEVEIPLNNLESANDSLVLNMVVSIEIDPPVIPSRQNFVSFFDSLAREDYEKLLKECLALYNSTHTKKK